MNADSEPADLCVLDDAQALARHVAEWLCALACASRDDFAVCLSGGSTPRRAYELLAAPGIAARFPWQRVHWFWGDERFVPHDRPESNYRMALEAFLSRVPVPEANVHAIPTERLSPEQAATAYEAILKRFYGAQGIAPERPLFDVTLLGLGTDGHTASLFPGQRVLEEKRHWAAAVAGPRITLTYPVLDASRDVAFVVAGAEKQEIVRRVQAGDRTLPAARIRPAGRLHWFCDRAAAGAGTPP